jgi:hypothetical protein
VKLEVVHVYSSMVVEEVADQLYPVVPIPMVKLYLDEEWMKVRPIVPGNDYRTESDLKKQT